MHFGGGTPTFLSPGELRLVLRGLAERLPARADGYEGSVEVDPRVTTREHLEAMREYGVTRISLGVQDFDDEVLRLVNRPQPKVITAALCDIARAAGYDSINFDLIYGLPGQTPASMERLAADVIALRPDRLAVYSFARVPWIKPAQRKFKDEDLPAGEAKRLLYEILRAAIAECRLRGDRHGSFRVAARFARARPHATGSLHRNFMGYTDRRTTALSASASARSRRRRRATTRTKRSSRSTSAASWLARSRRCAATSCQTMIGSVPIGFDALMTTGEADWDGADSPALEARLAELTADGLVSIKAGRLRMTPGSKPFLRNAAALYDVYLHRTAREGLAYSKAI